MEQGAAFSLWRTVAAVIKGAPWEVRASSPLLAEKLLIGDPAHARVLA